MREGEQDPKIVVKDEELESNDGWQFVRDQPPL